MKYYVSMDTGLSNSDLGYLDMTILLSLGFGLKIGGFIGDTFNTKYYVQFGLVLTTIMTIIIAICKLGDFVNLGFLCFIFSVFGLSESTIPPGLLKILS